MNKNYWVNFWNEYSQELKNKDPQTQVLRTFNKKPIDKELWEHTLSHIMKYLDIQSTDNVLDLCSGNGLITKEISLNCKTVTAVDISENLLKQIDTNTYNNINTIISDIRELSFNENLFNKIIIYAGIQYLGLKEVVILFKQMYKWLEKGGICFLGDIPDIEKRWEFFNTKERETIFFESIQNEHPIVGTWFDKNFLLKLSNYCGFTESKVIKQHKGMIYSHFRFDMYIKK